MIESSDQQKLLIPSREGIVFWGRRKFTLAGKKNDDAETSKLSIQQPKALREGGEKREGCTNNPVGPIY